MLDIQFKPLKPEHFYLLHKWIHIPHVCKWWGDGKYWSQDLIKEKYASYVEGYKIQNGEKKSIHPFIIEANDRPIGYIQFYDAYDFPRDIPLNALQGLPENLAALDFYIGEQDLIGKKLGAEILKRFLAQLIFPRFPACLVDPEKANTYAIKAYAQAGFTTFKDFSSSILMLAHSETRPSPIVIQGSSRGDGHTKEAITFFLSGLDVPLVDLQRLNISYYDYENRNQNDDFIPLAEQMVRHNPLILATPVYWYTMSAIMKTFIDRWTDLLDVRKDLGRRLAGKELYVIASYGGNLSTGFEEPFSQTCQYMDITYKGCSYYYSGSEQAKREENELRRIKFREAIFQGTHS